MLNLNETFEYTPLELAYLNNLRSPSKYDDKSWTYYKGNDEMKSLKLRMKSELMRIQNEKCVYCMQDIDTRTSYDGDREHFSNKERYPQFTFEKRNLLIACITCNRPLKNRYDTIEILNHDYSQCTFRIVHPLLDNVDDHIAFWEDVIIYAITDKGLKTIEVFKLDDPYIQKVREKELYYQRMTEEAELLIEPNILDLINAAVDYHYGH